MKNNYLCTYLIISCVLCVHIMYGTSKINSLHKKDSLVQVHEKQLLTFIEKHVTKRQFDSVAYYYEKVKKNTVSNEVLGIAELHISEKYIYEHQYFEAIISLYTALDYFKENNILDKEVDTYLKLGQLYKEIKSKDLAKEMDSILMHQYLNTSISKLQKSQIHINHASYIASLGRNEEAVALLKNIEYSDFSNNPYVLRRYNEELLKRYIKLELTDSAYVYIKRKYQNLNIAFAEDEAMKNIYAALISYDDKKYIKALQHVNIAEQSTSLKYVEQFERIKLYKASFLTNRALGKFENALEATLTYQAVRDSVKNFNINTKASILNFKLNRDKKIKALEAKNEMNAIIMEQKKKFYIFSTLLASVSVSIFIFLIILYRRRKKRLKLEYENEKMKEIALIKNNFIENLSHEIRTPITITTGYLQMISNNAMEYKKIIKYSDLTIRNNEQIIEMLNGFLTLLRLDKRSSVDKVTSNKMEKFLKEAVYAFQGVAEIKGVPIYYKSNLKVNQLLDYQYDDLRKIINNLISNALKYTSPTHGIYVHTYIDKNGLNLIVKDEGVGIDKEEQKFIFDRFYQSKNHLVTGGFGIGLSLVSELVTKLNGTIHLDSEKNVGSIFTIQLPLTIKNHLLYVEEKSTGYTNICSETITESTATNNLPKLLIVDDNIEMIGFLKELLSPTLNCAFAFDGSQALSFAKKTQYDIILTDLRMPTMDGHELKTALDKIDSYQSVPYIIMTASAEEYLESNKAELGINDYVIKPFEGAELITRINHHLEKNIYKKQLQNSDKESVEYNGAYAEFMKKINTIILKNLNNSEFSINDLAASCGYSHKQFTQIVQEQVGVTPVKLILEVRLRKAYDLIVTDKYQSISEVLYTVGLNSRSYFNKVFAKRFGLKPGELIKKLKVEKNAS